MLDRDKTYSAQRPIIAPHCALFYNIIFSSIWNNIHKYEEGSAVSGSPLFIPSTRAYVDPERYDNGGEAYSSGGSVTRVPYNSPANSTSTSNITRTKRPHDESTAPQATTRHREH